MPGAHVRLRDMGLSDSAKAVQRRYSVRKARIGSIRVARVAGTNAATPQRNAAAPK